MISTNIPLERIRLVGYMNEQCVKRKRSRKKNGNEKNQMVSDADQESWKTPFQGSLVSSLVPRASHPPVLFSLALGDWEEERTH